MILGMMPRSGTNFLSDLLCLHPDCAVPDPVLEDYLLHHEDILERYVDSVRWGWRPEQARPDPHWRTAWNRVLDLAWLAGGALRAVIARLRRTTNP